MQHGGQVVVRLDEGKLMLESVDDAIDRAQAIVRTYVRQTTGVIDELIAERRVLLIR